MNRYKNITNLDLEVVGVGFVKAGEVIETEKTVDSPNLLLEQKQQPKLDKLNSKK